MDTEKLQEIKGHLGLVDSDLVRVRTLGEFVEPMLADIVEAFYVELARHESALAVFTGGDPFRPWRRA